MEENKDKIHYIHVDDIIPNRFQPRLAFNESELNELSRSIARYGVIQPIVLRKIGDKYEIIAGERRYKASCLAGLKQVPAIINNTDDNTSAEIALLENLQRKNLTPIEEAQSYKKLMDRGFTQEDMANKLGVSQSAIANKLRLLNLPKKVQDALLYGKISERHARSLLSLNNEEEQSSLLERIILERLTVKQTEDEIEKLLNKSKIDNDIPDEIQRFINTPKEEVNNQNNIIDRIESMIDVQNREINHHDFNEYKVPEVVNIEEKPDNEITTKYENTSDINPFQRNDINKEERYERLTQNFREAIETKFNETDHMNVTEAPKMQNIVTRRDNNTIPRIVSNIREYIGELEVTGKNITTQEKDLPNKYQIIIEIDK